MAQDSGPFADVPADHWAYQSVDTLQKAGIVIGYPDGTYGGKRAMTRYEFATAIARLLPLIGGGGNAASKDDLAALRSDLEKKLMANSDAIDALRKMVDAFGPELQRLGQDVAAVKSRLDALEARVAVLEEEQRRVKINGVLNFIGMGEDVTTGPAGAFFDKNGYGSATFTKRVLSNTDVYHDFVLSIRGKVSDTATANVKLDFGNYLSAIGNTAFGGTVAGAGAGVGGPGGTPIGALSAANQATTIWEANLQTPVSLGPLGGANLVVGRFGNQWTKYTLRQTDADVYTWLDQTDSGNITTDGVKADFKLGGAGISAFAGQFKAVPFSQPYIGPGAVGAAVATLPAGLLPTNANNPALQGAGIRATFGALRSGVLGLNVEQFATPTGASPVRARAYGVTSVYGADYNGAIPFFGKNGLILDLNWTDSATASTSNSFNGVDKDWRFQATDDQVGFALGALSVKGGYQYVGPYFAAPGYWGKVGSWTNPSNVRGGVVSAKYVFSPKMSVNAEYQAYEAAYNATASPLQGGDKLDHYQVGLAYGLTSNYNVDLGYEQAIYKLNTNAGTGIVGGKPTQTFLTIGVGHPLNKNTNVKVLYQNIQYKDKGTGFLGADTTGNVLVGQVQTGF